MEDLAARGYTGVLHTFSENDLAYYREQMARIVDVSHDAGLEVQVGPWGVGGVFGGEAESAFAARHPELGQVFANGRAVGVPCPTRPEFRAFLRDWATAAVEIGADRVFWDEPHWAHPSRFGEPPESWTCVCESCRQQYAERFGSAMPADLTPEVARFREQVLVDLLTDVVGHVRDLGGRSTICLLPPVDGMHAAIDDWGLVSEIDGLDTLATDPYWSFFDLPVEEFVGGQARRLVEVAGKHAVRPQLWIQGYALGPEQEPEIRAAVAAARTAGVEDLWTWGFEAGKAMSYLGTRDPDRVWDILSDALTGTGRR